MNTHGGALSEGRLHSMGHLAEGVYQVTGRAGPRQVPGCGVAYVTAGSPMLRGSGLLLSGQSQLPIGPVIGGQGGRYDVSA